MNSLLKSARTILALMALSAGIDSAAAADAFTRVNIPVEHVRLVSSKSFDEVAAALEHAVPKLDPGVSPALAAGDEKRATELEKGERLFIFLTREHGALLQAVGRPAKA